MRAKYVCTVGRARRAILILWILSFILAIPILIGQVRILIGGEATILLFFIIIFFVFFVIVCDRCRRYDLSTIFQLHLTGNFKTKLTFVHCIS